MARKTSSSPTERSSNNGRFVTRDGEGRITTIRDEKPSVTTVKFYRNFKIDRATVKRRTQVDKSARVIRLVGEHVRDGKITKETGDKVVRLAAAQFVRDSLGRLTTKYASRAKAVAE